MTVKLDIRSGSVNRFYTPICGSYSLYKQSCILSYQVKKWSWNINSHSKAKTTETLDLYQAYAHEGPGRQRLNFLFYNLLPKNLRPGRYFISCCQFFILWYFTNKTRPTHFLFYPYFLDQGHLFFILLALYFIWVFEYATEPTERIQFWKRMRVKRNIAETEFTSISLQQSLRPFFKIFYLCVHVRVIF